MRDISSSKTSNVQVLVMDEPGQGGACHHYVVQPLTNLAAIINSFEVRFQKGPIQEFGVNGCQQEDLLLIVADRLRSFQAGPYPCFDNEKALTAVEEALFWLNKRTKDRQERGGEGKSVA
jgi:hypothetical protein